MPKIFSIKEILQFAVEKEHESQELYQALAAQVGNPDAKSLFKEFVIQEKKHEDLYKNMLANIDEYQHINDLDEYMSYMHELINTSHPESGTSSVAHMKCLSDILDYAVLREKESVLFYVGLRDYVSAPYQAQVDAIIKEEVQHIVQLSGLKKAI
ncbi:MAG: ferritin family protein [Pseudomonadota bacterium]